jgi:hypothetical protein
MGRGAGSNERDSRRHDLADTLRNPERRAKLSLLHNEMFEKLAPAVNGPIVRTGRDHRGRLVFGDALD